MLRQHERVVNSSFERGRRSRHLLSRGILQLAASCRQTHPRSAMPRCTMNVPRKEYSAKAIGHTLREVKCETCQADYVYVLKCEGIGSGTSVLFLDNQGAAERA